MEDAGTFRKDLRARLRDFPVELPPLRDRKEDLYRLVRTLLARHGTPHLELDMPCWTALFFHDYPGNVRELEAAIRRAALLAVAARRTQITVTDLPAELLDSMATHERRTSRGVAAPPTQPSPGATPTLPPTREQLRELLQQARGNVADVARALGRPRITVRRWIVNAGLDIESFRASAPTGTDPHRR